MRSRLIAFALQSLHKVEIIQLLEACLKRVVCFAAVAFSSLLGCQLGVANAAAFELKMFGHDVIILQRDFEQILMIEGREYLKDEFLNIEEVHIVGGVPTVVGSSSGGGNACDAAPFVISFPQGANPRLDGPIESCRPVQVDIQSDQIRFSTAALPNSAGEAWTWAPANGLVKSENQAFVPDASKGWATLRERTASHPSELLAFREIASQIDTLLGTERQAFSKIISGVGSGSFDGDYFIGASCTRHMCQEEEAMLVASIRDKQVFLAWKPSGEKIVVRPPVKQWPDRAKAALREWAAKWQ